MRTCITMQIVRLEFAKRHKKIVVVPGHGSYVNIRRITIGDEEEETTQSSLLPISRRFMSL